MTTDLFAFFDQPEQAVLATVVWTWAAPSPDFFALARLTAEGRSPFGEEGYDQIANQGIADETMNALVWEILNLRDVDRCHKTGRAAFRNDRAWNAFQIEYPGLRARCADAYEGTLDAIQDLWGLDGRAAFDQEARRRAEG